MIARMMLSVPCQALLYFPTVNKDKQTDGHHQSGCKDKTFWLLLRLFNKDIPSIPQEYLCQKAQKRAQAGMSVHENFRKVLNLWYENLRSVLAVPSGRIGRAV